MFSDSASQRITFRTHADLSFLLWGIFEYNVIPRRDVSSVFGPFRRLRVIILSLFPLVRRTFPATSSQ